MTEFDTTVCGIPCIVRVTYWEAYDPGCTSGPPERCYPAEGGDGEWEILDRNGRHAPWLENKMTERDKQILARKIFNYMENLHDDN